MSKSNWRVNPEKPHFVEMLDDSGKFRFPDCGVECFHCGQCMGCLRKCFHSKILSEYFECPLSPNGDHMWIDSEDFE